MLSELAVFNFEIKYHADKSHKAAEPLRYHPQIFNSSDSSDGESKEYETVSYATMCKAVTDAVNGEKETTELKEEVIKKGTVTTFLLWVSQ